MAEEEDSGGGIPEWVVTFGDMMSLLLTFFIMLVSLSEIKQEEKFQAMVESIKRQLGHTTSTQSMTPGPVRPRNSQIQQVANMGRSKRLDLMKGGDRVKAPQGENRTVRIIRPGERTARGVVLPFADSSDQLTDQAAGLLASLAQDLIGKPQLIEVRGHTTRRPLPEDSPFDDHWELAAARCRATMQHLVDDLGIEPERIRMTSAGPHEPIYTGTDPIQLRQNDRVEVFLLDQTVQGMVGN
ncbi:MAG: OmpA family protein [Planctomycetales bacterium]|nr:OmpA family protein [Planctomycetales bacterium]